MVASRKDCRKGLITKPDIAYMNAVQALSPEDWLHETEPRLLYAASYTTQQLDNKSSLIVS